MKYFRYYPWGLQLFLFLLMVFTMISLCSGCLLVFLPRIAGVQFADLMGLKEDSPFQLIKVSLIVQGISSAVMFILPSLLFAYFTHPKPLKYTGLVQPKKAFHIVLAVLLILGAMPLLEQLQAWIGLFNFSASLKASQAHNEVMMKAYLTMPTATDFIRTFLVMAIIPAIGEELFFRGILTRFLYKRTHSILFSIVFTSVIFAYIHSNIFGLLSICLAGAILASIYYFTGSLWCSIAAHMAFNGTQILLAYMAKTNASVNKFANSESIPVGLLVGGVVVFAGALYLLIKTQTPLPKTWGDDFEDEQPAIASEFDSIV